MSDYFTAVPSSSSTATSAAAAVDQAAIDAAVAKAVADYAASQLPPAPRELTPAEQVAALVARARADIGGEHTRPTGSNEIHGYLVDAVEQLLKLVTERQA